MAFTRFHDDPCRISKQNQQATDPGKYILDVPGNGTNLSFMADPYIRPQKWGGNLWCNKVNVQSYLLGINTQASKYNMDRNDDTITKVNAFPHTYTSSNILTTEQSRSTNPAWMYKDLEQPNWDYLPDDPQAHIERPFANNISSRIQEKDQFQRQFDCVNNYSNNKVPTINTNTHYSGGPTLCTQSNSCSNI